MSAPTKDWNPYVAGATLGFVLFLAFALTGNGIGGSGIILKLSTVLSQWLNTEGMMQNAFWAGSVDTPLLSLLNHRLVWGGVGLFLGGLLAGLLRGDGFKMVVLRGPNISVGARITLALVGGTITGWAARVGRGCTSGQALSGGSLLSVGSWAFMLSVFAGAYALAYFLRRQWR
ncbi:MAG: YeeE/YedE family protein [Deltaproteobacteria bacterium]|nr:YeeE/YedE family protein [Deltaproteobacteria bacterium]